ncbi:unnamed protein product [Adineta ricciae]|uniref:Uncharacterized protein n=1 Tax=Adineta ricciae TaxID=249248 RepID=A0A814FX55_ADIRI|nr:unnamed protein product [Adineta ricciae]CAF1294797.1 unnamed protein product [Adineta ricciae]
MSKQRQAKPYVDRFNESVTGWHQPNDLDPVRTKPTYPSIGTPPKLRTLVTPPGTEAYRNTYNLRRFNSPLPNLHDSHTPPARLDTWGLEPVDYRANQDLRSFIRQPSSLTKYGLANTSQRQKKSYIVVPRLSSLTSPPANGDRIDSRFSIPTNRAVASHVTDSQYRYLERIQSYSPNYQREPPDSTYLRKNEAFANRFIDDFIDKCIADQFIPDILLEVLGELDREYKKDQDANNPKFEADEYITELNKRVAVKGDSANLFSDEWMRELDYQRPEMPLTQIDSNRPLQNRLDFRDLISEDRQKPRSTYNDPMLTGIVQDVVNTEVYSMTTDITRETVADNLQYGRSMRDIYQDIESETIGELSRETAYDTTSTEKKFVSQVQLNSISKHAQNKLLDTIVLDQLIRKYIGQSGSVVDVDDLSRFLDGTHTYLNLYIFFIHVILATILDNLIYQYQDITESRSRTLDNYALRKFHLNSFMNMTMDLLLTELSASLIEDMKDLDEQERRVF